jgi:hypothetical protein
MNSTLELMYIQDIFKKPLEFHFKGKDYEIRELLMSSVYTNMTPLQKNLLLLSIFCYLQSVLQDQKDPIPSINKRVTYHCMSMSSVILFECTK